MNQGLIVESKCVGKLVGHNDLVTSIVSGVTKDEGKD